MVGSVLRWTALTMTIAIAAWIGPDSTAESAAFSVALVGVPLVAASLALVAQALRWAVAPVTLGAAIVMLGWGLFLGLGNGFSFVVPGLLLALAAASARPGAGKRALR